MSESLEKSVLDHVEVKDDAFPLVGSSVNLVSVPGCLPEPLPAAGAESVDSFQGKLVGSLEKYAEQLEDGAYQTWTAQCTVREKSCRHPRLLLTRAGSCPRCGSPIYASSAVEPGETPVINRSCDCFQTKGENVAAKKTPKAKAPAPAAPKAAKVKSVKKGKK